MSGRHEEPSESFAKRVFYAASVVVAFGIVACATSRPATSAADAALAKQVRLALNSDPQLYARHVDISVSEGVVRLGGYVWSAEEFTVARKDAAGVPGVKAVDDHMQLMRGGMAK